jgi:choline kinase
MNFIIPMAGNGSRFIEKGYSIPKFLIEVKNKKLLEYSLESLPLELATNIVFIALKEHNLKFDIKEEISKILKNKKFELVLLNNVTQGQAETVLVAKDYVDFSKDLIIFNIDTYFKSNSLKKVLVNSRKKKDGVLGSFKSEGTNWSFAKTDERGIIIETSEKIPISNNALTGFYHFTNPKDFFETAEDCVKNKIKFKNEYYIAPMYNQLIKKNKKFVLDFVCDFIPLGTPDEVEAYNNRL